MSKLSPLIYLNHIEQKDFQMSNTGSAPSFERLKEEADKCRLLCANCHREEHERLKQELATC